MSTTKPHANALDVRYKNAVKFDNAVGHARNVIWNATVLPH